MKIGKIFRTDESNNFYERIRVGSFTEMFLISVNFSILSFSSSLVATKRLYRRVGPSVRRSIGDAFDFWSSRSDLWPCIRPCFSLSLSLLSFSVSFLLVATPLLSFLPFSLLFICVSFLLPHYCPPQYLSFISFYIPISKYLSNGTARDLVH